MKHEHFKSFTDSTETETEMETVPAVLAARAHKAMAGVDSAVVMAAATAVVADARIKIVTTNSHATVEKRADNYSITIKLVKAM